jgi:DNA-binding CsgD family transcriptional regulator
MILGMQQPITASVAGRAVQETAPIVADGSMDGISSFPREISRSLLIPLRVSGRLVGVLSLNCETDPSRFEPETVGLTRLLGNQAANIIANARLYEQLAQKERRLEIFVDRMLRMQAEEKRTAGPSEAQLEAMLGNVMRRTLRQFSEATQSLPSGAGPEVGTLTEREADVLSLLVEGLTNKEIAARLYIKEGTVKNHLLRVMSKLGASDRTQAAVIAIRTGLLT